MSETTGYKDGTTTDSGWTDSEGALHVDGKPAPELFSGAYEPLTNGDPVNPELIFAGGDVIMVQMVRR